MAGVPLHHTAACRQSINDGFYTGLCPSTRRIWRNTDDCRQHSRQNTDGANGHLCRCGFRKSDDGLGLDDIDCDYLVPHAADDEAATRQQSIFLVKPA